MKKSVIFLFIIITTLTLGAQEAETVQDLPEGFRNIKLGLSIEEVKKLIENDGYFQYRGDPDVSMLLSENKSIIETDGKYYIERGYFQFYNENLYTITLVLDTEKVDYHTIFTKLKNKYGVYTSLSPKIVTWENSNVRLQLEKPLTLKYMSMNVLNELVEEDRTREAIEEKLKKEFLDEL